MPAPPIDKRGHEELVAATEALAQRLSDWRPAPDGQPDAGRALIRVFGRFAELVVERLNRAPDKSYLAFLNLIGISPLPPKPARAPLTFQLAEGSPAAATVPAGTLVAAPPLEGEEDEVVFETEQPLVVSRARLSAVYVRDTGTDTWGDRGAQAAGEVDEPFAAFAADQPTPHDLYLACDPLLSQPGGKDVTLGLRVPDASAWQWSEWWFSWWYWDGAAWRRVASSDTVLDGVWTVTLPGIPPLPPHAVGGIEAGWLRARLEMPLPPGETGQAPDLVAVGARNPEAPAAPLVPFPAGSQVRRFYLSADAAFGTAGARARLNIRLAQPGATGNVTLTWYYYQVSDQPDQRGQWLQLGRSGWASDQIGSDYVLRDETLALTRDGAVSFQVPMSWQPSIYWNRSGRWLRVDVDAGEYATPPEVASITVDHDWDLPRLGRATVRATYSAPPEPLPAEAAYCNATELDLSKDFYPLGEVPRFGDTFAVACPRELALPGALVRLSVTLANPPDAAGGPIKPVRTADGPELAWEVSDGRRWRAVPATYDLTGDGQVTFAVPDPVVPAAVNGDERFWLRARLIQGHFGTAATYTQDPDGKVVPAVATVAPPVIRSLSFMPVLPEQEQVVTACVTGNDFAYADHTAEAAAPAVPREGPEFTPFLVTSDTEPALYLGFDRPFEPRPIALYLQVEPPRPEEVAADRLAAVDLTAPAQVTWEYAGPTGWWPLGALDETGAFSDRGVVAFAGPEDLVSRARFGRELYWLRARWHGGAFPLPPRLRRVLLNTTWAVQATTVDGEILGASNGDPDQVFTAAHTPVQPGQRLVVREPEPPAPAELRALQDQEGADAVTVTTDAAGLPDEVWVRWHAVPDLYGSGGRDRHYTVDALTGEVRFGNGASGMIPPRGQGNIRLTYRTGGSERGNRAAGTIVELKSGLPYVDGVVNHEPAQGGAPPEPIERLAARGPRVLRHRDRAVTAQDLEDLAAAASAEVARAAVITPAFSPFALWLDKAAPVLTEAHAEAQAGRIGVIVVPNAATARPTPSLGLLRTVLAHLRARCPATADVWVAGPEWVAVTVAATVTPTSFDAADAARESVRVALERYLHPLTGGPDGGGWAFGRKPHRSDLIALIEGVEGVDSVRALTVTLQPETEDLDLRLQLQRLLSRPLTEPSDETSLERDLRRWLDRALVYSGRHRIGVAFDAGLGRPDGP